MDKLLSFLYIYICEREREREREQKEGLNAGADFIHACISLRVQLFIYSKSFAFSAIIILVAGDDRVGIDIPLAR